MCQRSGRIKCSTCHGSGRLRWFLELTVNFKNNEEDYIKNSESIPADKIRNCLAQSIFAEQSSRVTFSFVIMNFLR